MIQKKLYYSISEVCTLTGLEQHVLRYWESEFPQLRPKKNRAGNRAYREKDIEIIKYIKHLLYEEKFTIPGAKKKLSESKFPVDIEPGNGTEQILQTELELAETVDTVTITGIKNELRDILDILKSETAAVQSHLSKE